MIVEEMLQRDADELAIMGLDKRGALIIVSINGRELFDGDTECILCKIAITTRKIGGSFSGSTKINIHQRQYEWPLPFEPVGMEGIDAFQQIANRSIRILLSKKNHFLRLSICDRFIFSNQGGWNEEKEWKKSCEQLLQNDNHPLNSMIQSSRNPTSCRMQLRSKR